MPEAGLSWTESCWWSLDPWRDTSGSQWLMASKVTSGRAWALTIICNDVDSNLWSRACHCQFPRRRGRTNTGLENWGVGVDGGSWQEWEHRRWGVVNDQTVSEYIIMIGGGLMANGDTMEVHGQSALLCCRVESRWGVGEASHKAAPWPPCWRHIGLQNRFGVP